MRGSQVSLGMYRRIAAVSVVLGVIGGLSAVPAYAEPTPAPRGEMPFYPPVGTAASAECSFPSKPVSMTPWSLQRVRLDQLWEKKTGAGIVVAVIDTGVDNANVQLQGKVVDAGSSLKDKSTGQMIPGTGVTDDVGHGTKVAGIIAAKRMPSVTGFAGIAPDATIRAYRQNDSKGNGDVVTLANAIKDAVNNGVHVINISQDVRATEENGTTFAGKAELVAALDLAEKNKVVVVASAGNEGQETDTYPAAFETVLAVGASNRNNERALFSQYGAFVDVVAPGEEMLSTVPGGGHCVDNGTSFSTPYVAGVAALIRARYPDWTANQVRNRIMQTAQRVERSQSRFIGWGVVDPVKAVNSELPPIEKMKPDETQPLVASDLQAQPLGLAETQQDRDARTATYAVGMGGLLVGGLAGGSVVLRDRRRRQD